MNDGGSTIRVLHLIPSAGGGGAERQLAYLAGGLTAIGVDVHVAIRHEGINLPRLEASGASIHRISSRNNYDPFLLARTIRLIRSVRPDVVQTWLTQMDVVGGAAALLTGRPWIVSERSSAMNYPRNVKHTTRRRLGRFATAVIANSPGGLALWRGSRVKPFVVPNALPFDEITAAVPRIGAFGAAQVVLFVGRLDREKNLPNLIDALAPIVLQRDAVALFCGTGPLEDETRKGIENKGCADRIRLLGFQDDVWSLMKRADVLVAPSWWEGHPNAVLEAAACGCPLVVSDIPAHRAFLDESTALFAPPEDAEALSRAIGAALQDRPAALARAANARTLVARWSIANVSAEYARIYEEVSS